MIDLSIQNLSRRLMTNLKKLSCYGRSEFETLVRNVWKGLVPPGTIVISIENTESSGSGSPHVLESSEDVLNLEFDDIAVPHIDLGGGIELFGISDSQASKIVDFIQSRLGSNIVVHCSAGKSRSQGIVRFVLDAFPEEYTEADTREDNPCISPNFFVTGKLKRILWKSKFNDT